MSNTFYDEKVDKSNILFMVVQTSQEWGAAYNVKTVCTTRKIAKTFLEEGNTDISIEEIETDKLL